MKYHPQKDCYFLAIKRALYGKRYEQAHQKRIERQAFLRFLGECRGANI